uniref:Uncharacterized protein n=1 Tax=Percolomonas cosmopolitus TaxID=63605 RepID=A0A7S1KNB5_9EUKA
MSYLSHIQQSRRDLIDEKKQDVTFLQYIVQELNMEPNGEHRRNEGWNDEALETLYRSPNSIRSGVYNFLRVPFSLERFIAYAIMVCIDTFLYYVTLLPIRLIFTAKKLLLRHPLKIQDICDILRLFTMFVTLFTLMPLFNYSFLYHYIRGQSTLKLYVTYNMLELFDKMSSAFGIDIQDAMYYSATKLYFDRGVQVPERFFVARDCVLSIFGYIVYLFIHTTLLYVRIITLNVALNSSNNALFTLLVSNNFLELKKPIFKRFAKENVFQFSCHDATERFQLLIFGLIIAMQNSRAAVFTGQEIWDVSHCLMAEVVVDFLKHAFIAKFNDISSTVYGKFLDKLCEDMTDDRLQDTFLDNMNIASRRLGFTPIPLVTIVLYVTYLYFDPSRQDSLRRWLFYFQLFITLLLFKLLINIFVVGFASRRRVKMEHSNKLRMELERLKQGSKNALEDREDRFQATNTAPTMDEDNEHNPSRQLNLTKIFRYALFGKRLPE